MTPERWQQVKEILHRALQKEPEERSAYLTQACEKDSCLQREVESLLASGQGVAKDFLRSGPPDCFAPGTRLGPYEIVSLVGAGGMGEVYRAHDTRLGRDVAIKVIPSFYSSDPLRRQRFQREARAISLLQHPNICTLYDIGEQDGTDYLVMEYLAGETLSAKLAKGPLNIEQILAYGIEVASALDAAHSQNIVHCDLKPGNIMITTHGECKVLDFGLAKLEKDGATTKRSVTEPELLKGSGVMMGTLPYMSPEQARGESLDERTDIFSFGAVLYEMATAKIAFSGKTSVIVFKAILDLIPSPPSQLNRSLPYRLDELIGKCLEKDRELRFQSAAEVRADLKRLKRDSESLSRVADGGTARTDTHTTSRQTRWSLTVTGLIVLLAIAAVVSSQYRGNRMKDAGDGLLDIQALTESGDVRLADISPDGRYVAYVPRTNGRDEIRLLQVATKQEIIIVPGGVGDISRLCFSPEGNFVYFEREVDKVSRVQGVYRVASFGGLSTLIVQDQNISGFTLSPDASRLAYSARTKNDSQIVLVRIDGSDKTVLSKRPVDDFFWNLQWSPAGNEIAAIISHAKGPMDLAVVSERNGAVRSLITDWGAVGQPAWTSNGSTIFVPAVPPSGNPVMQIWSVNVRSGAFHPVTSGTFDYDQSSLSITTSDVLLAVVDVYQTSLWTLDNPPHSVKRIHSLEGEGWDGVAWVGERLVTSDMGALTVHTKDNNPVRLSGYSDVYRHPIRCGPSHIVFWGADREHGSHIGYFDIDSGTAAPLAQSEDAACTEDGATVVYLHCDTPTDCYLVSKKMAAGDSARISGSDVAVMEPKVSPDGKFLLLVKEPDVKKPLEWAAILPVTGGVLRTVAMPVAMNLVGQHMSWGIGAGLRWSADGKSVLYVLNQDGIDNIWSYPLGGGQPREVTHFDSDGIFAFDVDPKGRLLLSRGKLVQNVAVIRHVR